MLKNLAAVALITLLGTVAIDAARPGGGETYSRERESRDDSSSSRSSSYDRDRDSGDLGDNDALASLAVVLIVGAYHHPFVVLAFLIIVVLYGAALAVGEAKDWETISKSMHAADSGPAPPRVTLNDIRTADPDFSSVLFEDFVFRLYATAHTSRGAGRLDELAPYFSTAARRVLAERQPVNQPISGVVIGNMRIINVAVPPPNQPTGEFKAFVKVRIQFEANYSAGTGAGSRRFVIEDWLLRREANVKSKPPDAQRRFACPNCGAPWRNDAAAGTQKCASCGAVVDNGRFDWQVEDIKVRRESANIPGLEADVPEEGTALPTLIDQGFKDTWSALLQEDPAVTADTVAARLQYIYKVVNEGWSRNDLREARSVLSDGLADYFQYWLDAYQSSGLRNALDDMTLTRHEFVKLVRDRYYDALTIRIWATGKDYVVRTDKPDTIVRGSRDTNRDYSEYWTLIRSSARRGAPRADATCGSCGAPLTVTMAGECEHCGSHVTAGEFDWVLSKIEQDEAYQG